MRTTLAFSLESSFHHFPIRKLSFLPCHRTAEGLQVKIQQKLVSLSICYSQMSLDSVRCYPMFFLHLNAETAPSLSFHIVQHGCLINCSSCSCLHYAENFGKSLNPFSLSLMASDAQVSLFSTHILFDVGVKYV